LAKSLIVFFKLGHKKELLLSNHRGFIKDLKQMFQLIFYGGSFELFCMVMTFKENKDRAEKVM